MESSWLVRQTGNVYKSVKKKIEKGIAFPTCISVNNTICHFSPLGSDETVLEGNDVVKMYDNWLLVIVRSDCLV